MDNNKAPENLADITQADLVVIALHDTTKANFQ